MDHLMPKAMADSLSVDLDYAVKQLRLAASSMIPGDPVRRALDSLERVQEQIRILSE